MTPQQEVVTTLLKKFPKASAKTLARIAYRDNPALFTDLERARGAFRYRLGSSGNTHRKSLADKSLTRAPRTSGDPFRAVPNGKTYFDEWQSFQVNGPIRALIIGDLHIPYHNRAAVVSALRYGKEHRADTILLNGDIADFFSVSFWEKDPRKRNFKDELEKTRKFLASLRAGFPKARIVYKIGNHEERWERYMRVKAPEMLGVEEFEYRSILHLDQHNIELVEEKRPVRLGQLNVLHGHEYRFAISNPVNPARGLFLKAKAYAACNHFHQMSSHSDKTVEEKKIATWSIGCLCDMHPEYAPMNNWSLGFAFVKVEEDGKFHFDNKLVSNGKVF